VDPGIHHLRLNYRTLVLWQPCSISCRGVYNHYIRPHHRRAWFQRDFQRHLLLFPGLLATRSAPTEPHNPRAANGRLARSAARAMW